MKMFHLSDLHLGKRFYEYSLIEDQKYILRQVLSLAEREKPSAVLLAGDIYDKSVPTAEAVELFDDFLYRLTLLGVEVFLISGNHDSAERVSFGGRMMERSGVHISRVYDGNILPVRLQDEYGEINFYLLPFVRPGNVRRFSEEEINSYTDMVRIAVQKMGIDESKRNILLSHQFVTGASRSGSEEFSVGGTDNVDASVFAPFDYVALGHIHSTQQVGTNARYCGSLLKYSFSEVGQEKSITVIDCREKGKTDISTLPLTPMHDLVEIKGTFAQVMSKEFYQTQKRDAYIRFILTDEEDVTDAMARLRTVYPFATGLDYENRRTRYQSELIAEEDVREKSKEELFSDFYELQNNQPMSEEQRIFLRKLIKQIEEEGE